VFHAGFGLDTVFDSSAGAVIGDAIQVDSSLFADFAAISVARCASRLVVALRCPQYDRADWREPSSLNAVISCAEVVSPLSLSKLTKDSFLM
jgi:hypothetical protein